MVIVESIDAADTARLAIFISSIDNEYNATEEMHSLMPVKYTTKSLDLYEAAKRKKQFSISLVNLSDVATDGATVMVGKKEGHVKLIENDATTSGNPHFMKYHCSRNQEKLCAKALKMGNVIRAVNFIKSRGLNHL